MKRIALVLLALLVVFGFASCSKNQAAAKNEKVTVKAMGYGDNANQEGVNWKRIVDEFQKANPNITIQDEMLYDEAYHQKVTARLASGDIPDFAYMGADARWGKPWKEAGQQFDHRPLIDPNVYDLSLIPPMGPNGEIYEIPLGTSNITTVLFMNKKLADELKIQLPADIKALTYEDLVKMVPVAKKAGKEVISIDGADGWAWGSCFMSAVVARMTGDANWVSKAVAGTNKFTDQAFIDSLSLLTRMVKDGVISKDAPLVDYGTNVSNFSNGKALFMIQGQWVAGSIDPAVADGTLMLPLPKLPGEKDGVAGSVAAAIQVGYGLTKSGASNPAVRDAAMKFINYFYSVPETTQRLRDGAIVAPILKNYQVPADLPSIVKQKVVLAQTAKNTDVIDAFLSGAPNDELNAGMQKIVSGTATPKEVAEKVQGLLSK